MVKVLDRITLDLNKDELHGFERWKNAIDVAGYIEMNLAGKRPPLPEVTRKDGIYQLVVDKRWRARYRTSNDKDYNYGGHNRSVSHYISGDKLDCILLDDHRFHPGTSFFPIKNIYLRWFDNSRVRNFLRSVPDDISGKFIDMCRYCNPNTFENNGVEDNFFKKMKFDLKLKFGF